MDYIYNNRNITLSWTLYKVGMRVKEDFSLASSIAVFLIGPGVVKKKSLTITVNDGTITADIGSGLDAGTYSLEAIWIKSKLADEGENENRPSRINVSRIDSAFGITDVATEDTTGTTDDDVTITARTSVDSYGYDGLDAYQLAVLMGMFSGSMEDFINQHISDGSIVDVKEEGFYIVDSNLNIGFWFDEEGLHGVDTGGGGTYTRSNLEKFLDDVETVRTFDTDYNCYYYLTIVHRKKYDGTIQIPHIKVYEGNDINCLRVATEQGFSLVSNCGMSYPDSSGNYHSTGLTIQDGVVYTEEDNLNQPGLCMPCYWDKNGNMGVLPIKCTGAAALAAGAYNAFVGFIPILQNGVAVDHSIWGGDKESTDVTDSKYYYSYKKAQRKIIGQFSNGDYGILTVEGRGKDVISTLGLSINEAEGLCKKLGFVFAYNCDGGGSTQTCIGTKNLNIIYDNTTAKYGGRYGNTFLVFY